MSTLVADTSVRIPTSTGTVWRPTEKQYLERDTLFLLDPDYEATLAEGQRLTGAIYFDALLGWTEEPVWQVSSHVQAVAGKYRKGIQSQDNVSDVKSWLYMPDQHIPAEEFTIEFWVKADADWSSLGQYAFFQVDGPTQAGLSITGNGSTLTVSYLHDQSSTGRINRSFTYDTHGLSGQWINLALTFSTDNKLTLYRDGVQVQQITAVTPPSRWNGTYTSLRLLYSLSSGQPHFVMSDFRISRKCRTPNQSVSLNGNATLAVTTTATGATIQKNLLGIVHSLNGAATIANAVGALKVGRTDKLLTATPIKAGATDATHPTLGHSGAYSYDWQVVDRSIGYIVDTLGCVPYISIDACPQVLGGSVAPFTGSALANNRASSSAFPNTHPNDYTEWAKIVGDLVHYCTVTKGWNIGYWGVWNEPDLNPFWSGTDDADRLANYLTLYDATANAVKGINSSLKVGGPEVSNFTQARSWVTTLIQHCQTNSIPLDFISTHWYSGDISEMKILRSVIEKARTDYSFTGQLEIICGEFGWLLGPPYEPWRSLHIGKLDHTAAYYSQALVEWQRQNVVKAFVYDAATNEIQIDGALMSTDGAHKWPTLNVFKQWYMMSDTVVSSTLTGPPWLDAICSKNGATLDVFLSCLKYRKESEQGVEITVPSADGTTVSIYRVDDQHASYEAGSEDLAATTTTVQGGKVTLSLRPRSSTLVRIG